MMPPYPEKALLAGRHWMFAQPRSQGVNGMPGTADVAFWCAASQGRSLMIRKFMI